jgi:hypothetical protein
MSSKLAAMQLIGGSNDLGYVQKKNDNVGTNVAKVGTAEKDTVLNETPFWILSQLFQKILDGTHANLGRREQKIYFNEVTSIPLQGNVVWFSIWDGKVTIRSREDIDKKIVGDLVKWMPGRIEVLVELRNANVVGVDLRAIKSIQNIPVSTVVENILGMKPADHDSSSISPDMMVTSVNPDKDKILDEMAA